MNRTLHPEIGFPVAVLTENGDFREFYKIADFLSENLEVEFNSKKDEFDTLMWEFNFRKGTFTLLFNIYNGISIIPTVFNKSSRKDEETIMVLKRTLEENALC